MEYVLCEIEREDLSRRCVVVSKVLNLILYAVRANKSKENLVSKYVRSS
jgi:hypothetical protein